MKIKLMIGLFLFSISLILFAQEVPSSINITDDHVTAAQEKLITNALLYLNKFWADKGKSLSRNITKEYFDPDTTLIINSKNVYRGYDQFDTHFQEVGKHIVGKIRFPLREVIGVENKVIVRFDEDIHESNGSYYPATVMAILTLRKGRILQWEEVVDSKYFCQTEAASVVYSK